MTCKDCMWFENDCHYAMTHPEYNACEVFKDKNSREDEGNGDKSENPYKE